MATSPASPPDAPAPTRPPRLPRREQRKLIRRFLRLTLAQRRPDPARLVRFTEKIRQQVPAAYAQLPAVQQNILSLRLVDGELLAEIGILLDRPAPWVLAQQAEALARLCHTVWTRDGVL